MPEIEAIKAKTPEETTMAEAIVLFFAGDENEKKEALNRIDFLQKKGKQEISGPKKSMQLGLSKEL